MTVIPCLRQSWAHPRLTSGPSSRRPPARRLVGALRNLSEFGALQPLRRKAVELLKAHDQRPPFVGIDAMGLAVHHDSRMRANLDCHEVAAPDFVFLRHSMDLRDL